MSENIARSEEKHENEIGFIQQVTEALKPIQSEINKPLPPLEIHYEDGRSFLHISQVSPGLMGKIKNYLTQAGLIKDKEIAADAYEEDFELTKPADEPHP